MKKLLFVFAGLAIICLGGLVAIAFIAADKLEKERNRARTEPARAARLEQIANVKETAKEVPNDENTNG